MSETNPGESLTNLILREKPGTNIEVLKTGKALVVGLHHQSDDVWMALSYQPASVDVESALGSVANMLVCCQNCTHWAPHLCHQEYRLTSHRLRQFLGEAGYQRFLAGAPIHRSGRRPSLAALLSAGGSANAEAI
jgi:hypothetical protein